eukprot:COSAG04_NODE_451_length_14146_cov_611.491920_19_plen_175_part_00
MISMCSRVGFLGTLWPAVCDLLAVSLGRYVSPTIYLGGGRVALPDLSELGCWRPQTRPPYTLSSSRFSSARADSPDPNRVESNKASEQRGRSAGFLLVGRGILVSRQEVPGKVTCDPVQRLPPAHRKDFDRRRAPAVCNKKGTLPCDRSACRPVRRASVAWPVNLGNGKVPRSR